MRFGREEAYPHPREDEHGSYCSEGDTTGEQRLTDVLGIAG